RFAHGWSSDGPAARRGGGSTRPARDPAVPRGMPETAKAPLLEIGVIRKESTARTESSDAPGWDVATAFIPRRPREGDAWEARRGSWSARGASIMAQDSPRRQEALQFRDRRADRTRAYPGIPSDLTIGRDGR